VYAVRGGHLIGRRLHTTGLELERAFLVAVETRRNGARGARWDTEGSLEELAQLVATAGGVVVGRAVQKLASPNPALYIGRGKLAEIVGQRERAGYTMVVFDDELSPTQQRNLERALAVKVLDRTALILDIFAMRAQTREGRLQVDLAQAEYLLPRLAGQWSHLERLGRSGAAGSIGVRGPGETQIETDRRLARNKITRLKREIESVRRQRSLYRYRRGRAGIAVVALVGYTNAGKSTLMRALTKANVLVEDQLFATLDPTTRRVRLPSGATALLTDTVGFIQKLPTQLVAAFQATLEELAAADLLLHVVDITHPDAAQQAQTVDDTLAQLGLSEKARVVALNKIDLLTTRDGRALADLQELADYDLALARARPEAVLISAERGWGLDELLGRIEAALPQRAAAGWAPAPTG
jgi:GTP-binding protein HflX